MPAEATILIVEDEEKIRRMLRLFLEQEAFDVLEAEEGLSALDILRQRMVDLVILDLMMPGLDGWTTCRKIREISELPILILTARGEEADRVLGFELGADDYVVKPFSPREIVLRVKALLRRRAPLATANSGMNQGEAFEKGLHFPELSLYPEGRKAVIQGETLSLSPLEYDLLLYLAQHAGRVMSRDLLLDRVWGYEYGGDSRTVDTHVRRLREKLSRLSPTAAGYVITVRGSGYKFEISP
ncbi:response regulator [Heliobacterium gestii]|uniref:Stage 0 sporulation protein A homolog n=1 Tax=Heliomicrobium gestii TaxID=2699 RepID=A0A845L9C9_HELGE|nr:response regulator transcription factor [Heliomicrobium gestii]MBM7866761.1 two-component system response regulator ResD [Heliomicrobium gestii]MZP42191.1 response regulator [Heliomicrobium gestii]